MDSNNGSPPPPPPPPQGGDPSMEAGDWRSQLQSDSRQIIVNKILDTLKRHLPFSGQEGLHELKKITVRFEEKIYTAATSQSDYLRKLSLKLLTMETKSQNTMVNSLQTDSAGNSYRPPEPGFMDSNYGNPPPPPQAGDPSMSGLSSPQGLDMSDLSSALPLVSTMSGVSSARPPALVPTSFVDYTAQTGHTNGADWQEEVYQKIKIMKEMYYPELSEMHQKIAAKLQQHDSVPQQPRLDQLEKLKEFKTMLERLITVLQVSKTNISPGLKDELGLYEKHMINFIKYK